MLAQHLHNLTQRKAGVLLVAWSASQRFTPAVEQSDVYAGQLIAAVAFRSNSNDGTRPRNGWAYCNTSQAFRGTCLYIPGK
jgi:hypothetical protein